MFTVRRLAARLALMAPLAALSVVACEQEPTTIGFLPTIEVTRNPHTSTVTASGQPVAAETDTHRIPLTMAPEREP
jgi:hypothetical protein